MNRRSARGTIKAESGTIFNDFLSSVNPKQLTNKTRIAGHAGKVLLSCDHCGLSFLKKSSHVNIGGGNYCGTGCSAAAQRRRVLCNCIVCGGEFLIWPCAAKNGRATCGKPECIHERQRVVAKARKRDGEHKFTGDNRNA